MGDNTIHVNQTTTAFAGFFDICGKDFDRKTVRDFREWAALKYAAGQKIPAAKTHTEDMTMDEYRQYIFNRISALDAHPSNQLDTVSVHISEDGFKAMKSDPAYEKWVLDTLQTNFLCNDPWSSICGGKYVVFYFGAEKEEARGESWRAGFQGGKGESIFNRKSEDSFWELRAKRRKRYQEQYEELLQKRADAKKIAEQKNEPPAAMQAFFQLTWNLPD